MTGQKGFRLRSEFKAADVNLNEKLTVKHFDLILVSFTSREHNLIIICMDSSMIIHVWGSTPDCREKEFCSNPLYNSVILTTYFTKGLYGKHNKLTYR